MIVYYLPHLFRIALLPPNYIVVQIKNQISVFRSLVTTVTEKGKGLKKSEIKDFKLPKINPFSR